MDRGYSLAPIRHEIPKLSLWYLSLAIFPEVVRSFHIQLAEKRITLLRFFWIASEWTVMPFRKRDEIKNERSVQHRTRQTLFIPSSRRDWRDATESRAIIWVIRTAVLLFFLTNGGQLTGDLIYRRRHRETLNRAGRRVNNAIHCTLRNPVVLLRQLIVANTNPYWSPPFFAASSPFLPPFRVAVFLPFSLSPCISGGGGRSVIRRTNWHVSKCGKKSAASEYCRARVGEIRLLRRSE